MISTRDDEIVTSDLDSDFLTVYVFLGNSTLHNFLNVSVFAEELNVQALPNVEIAPVENMYLAISNKIYELGDDYLDSQLHYKAQNNYRLAIISKRHHIAPVLSFYAFSDLPKYPSQSQVFAMIQVRKDHASFHESGTLKFFQVSTEVKNYKILALYQTVCLVGHPSYPNFKMEIEQAKKLSDGIKDFYEMKKKMACLIASHLEALTNKLGQEIIFNRERRLLKQTCLSSILQKMQNTYHCQLNAEWQLKINNEFKLLVHDVFNSLSIEGDEVAIKQSFCAGLWSQSESIILQMYDWEAAFVQKYQASFEGKYNVPRLSGSTG